MKKIGEYDESVVREWALANVPKKDMLNRNRLPQDVISDAEKYFEFLTRGNEKCALFSIQDKGEKQR